MEPRPEHYTCHYLLRFWKRSAPERGVNSNTANAVRIACMRVLGKEVEDGDVRRLDVQDLMSRFEKEYRDKLAAETIESYKARFQYGLEAYLSFLKDPAGWEPGYTPRGRAGLEPVTGMEGGYISYRFPLRKEQDVVFSLPRDLTMAEVKKLSAFLATLANDYATD